MKRAITGVLLFFWLVVSSPVFATYLLGTGTNTATTKTISTSPVTLLSTDPEDVRIDVQGGARVVNMPSAATVKYFRFRVYQTSGNSGNLCTLTRAGSDTFTANGSNVLNTLPISPGDVVEVRSDGVSSWEVLSSKVHTPNSCTGEAQGLSSFFKDTFGVHASTVIGTLGLSNDYRAEMVYYLDATSGSFNCNLPAIQTNGTTFGHSRVYVFVKTTAANTVTLDANSTQTINGALTFPMTEAGEVIAIQNANGVSGTDWKIIWHYLPSRDGTLSTANGGTGSTTFPTSGIHASTAANTYTGRTITGGGTTGITITNGDGVSGNPTIAITKARVTSTGSGTLVGGTLTVNDAAATATAIIVIQDTGGTVTNLGILYEDKANRVANTSFVAKSSSALDVSNFSYLIFEP